MAGSETSIRPQHSVLFYESDEQLLDAVLVHLGTRPQDATAIVIVTPDHASALARKGLDGRVVVEDAAELLAKFMVGATPDARAFDDVVGTLVRSIPQPRFLFGEMVALLWAEGNVAGALELERLWNTLLGSTGGSLLCAYPSMLVDGAVEREDVCAAHSEVLTVPAKREASESFPASAESPRRARAFVVDALRAWGAEDLVDDAALIATELATNAVVHTNDRFTITVGADGSRVRIACEDASSTLPVPVSMPDTTGRGLHLVEAMSARWGTDPTPGGKIVWAELERAR